MTLEEIGKITIMKPDITVQDFFNSVIVFHIYVVDDKSAELFIQDRKEIIFDGNRITYRESEKDNTEEINAVNEVLLKASENMLYCIQLGNDKNNDGYVSAVIEDKKNRITLCFFEYGVIASVVEKYGGKLLFSCTQEDDEGSFFQKVFFYFEEEENKKKFEKEMNDYFVENQDDSQDNEQEEKEEEEDEIS